MHTLFFYLPGFGGGGSPPPAPILPPPPTPAPVAKKADPAIAAARAEEVKKAKLRRGIGGTNVTKGALVDDALRTRPTLLS
jgi:hypothetical protein